MKRREFVQWGMAIGAAASKTMTLFAQAPAVRTGVAKPVVVASANGNTYKNGGPQTGVERAFGLMTSGNADVLDALIAGVNICELDPADDSVGYGGPPNADGIVQLDFDDPKALDLDVQFVKLAVQEQPTIPIMAYNVMVCMDQTYWTGYPDSEHPYTDPVPNWGNTKYMFPKIQPKT